jgi:hypothetical protein
MDGSTRRARLATSLALLAAFAAAGRADAAEVAGIQVELHGFYELQLRGIARDFDVSDDLDLTQWYNVFGVEAEFDFAPNGWGPFDVLQGFLRVEVRYDCVWTHGCGVFSSANAYGDRAHRLPKRVADGRRSGFFVSGTLDTGDKRKYNDVPREFLPYEFRNRPSGSAKPSFLFNIEGIDTLFDSGGVDGVFGTADDPAPFYFERPLENCRFTFRRTKGSQGGVGVQDMVWNPNCKIEPIARLANKPNPLRAGDVSPLTGTGGSGALPLRPAPELRAGSGGPDWMAQGVYYPNQRLAQMLRDDDFDSFDQNYRQEELAWNRGASQQDEKELKEAYLDLELFDSRLWLRIGKQTVVWGKTELFRNQDRWNPQDLALASLPSLEESRIGLWMARLVWQFWQVGPFEDVRAEFVLAYDQFEPTDVGRCGEPYSPNPACNKTFGLFIHGLTGFALAGEQRPPDPWNDLEGLEVGMRLEWRWNRFSFAITDFYGYSDLPYTHPLFSYSRNVDPASGRPRHTESDGRCRTGKEPACLGEDNALTGHSVNQQLFSMICATSIGFSNLDTAACGQTILNSTKRTGDNPDVPATTTEPRVVVALNSVVAGDPLGLILPGLAASLSGIEEESTVSQARQAAQLASFGITTPLLVLNVDPADGGVDFPAGHPLLSEPDFGITVQFFYQTGTGAPRGSLSARLSDAQEALLGCGPYYHTSCDLDGIDLMNAEGSAIFQSWPGFEGTVGDWDTADGSLAQPGTVGFRGGPPCSRFEDGKTFILPGCRGPGDDGYDPRVDGTPANLVHPFTGQRFRSEMSALSWNALMGFVAFSASPEITITSFDVNDMLRTDGCSFRKPQLCGNVQSLYQVTGVRRNDVRAGGNGTFGRRDFVWSAGRELVLRYQKLNILGFSMDFAEDVTKSNWGLEFTWEDDVFEGNNDTFLGYAAVDRYNLTVSVDRPTFVNFLNANRTFFINTQWFFQYVSGYNRASTGNGPLNVLAVFTVNTGYFDDRLQPAITIVYDFGSNSAALIPQVTYRYTANFSATFGLAVFEGREEPRPMALFATGPLNRAGRNAYNDFVENGISAVRDRDEIFLRIRYTF